MIKAAFFDVDGTLVSFNTHKISELSKKAILTLKQKNIKVFVATGRALYQIKCGKIRWDVVGTLV